MNKRNAMIESLRGLACLLVVFVHFRIKNDFGIYVISLARFAVPFFLIVSGYFSRKPTTKENISFAGKRLFYTTRLLIIGIAVCIMANTMQCVLKGEEPFKWFMDVVGLKTILKLIIFNRAYWLSYVMYYLFMMVYVYIAYILINKLNLVRIAYYFIPVLLLINVVVCKAGMNWYYVGNFFFTGFPFFMLGHWIKEKNISFSSSWKNILAIAAGIILTFVETFLSGECYCYVGTIVLSVSLFLLGIRYCDLKIPQFISGFGTHFSMLIFLLHAPVGCVLITALELHGITLGSFGALAVIAATIFVSVPVVLVESFYVKSQEMSFHRC